MCVREFAFARACAFIRRALACSRIAVQWLRSAYCGRNRENWERIEGNRGKEIPISHSSRAFFQGMSALSKKRITLLTMHSVIELNFIQSHIDNEFTLCVDWNRASQYFYILTCNFTPLCMWACAFVQAQILQDRKIELEQQYQKVKKQRENYNDFLESVKADEEADQTCNGDPFALSDTKIAHVEGFKETNHYCTQKRKEMGIHQNLSLDPNHSHFIFADDGSFEFGTETQLRADVECCLAGALKGVGLSKTVPVSSCVCLHACSRPCAYRCLYISISEHRHCWALSFWCGWRLVHTHTRVQFTTDCQRRHNCFQNAEFVCFSVCDRAGKSCKGSKLRSCNRLKR